VNQPARASVRFSVKPGASAQRLIGQCEELVGPAPPGLNIDAPRFHRLW